MRRPLQILFTAVFVLAAAACGSPSATPASTAALAASSAATTDPTSIQLLTQPRPEDACNEALATGTLVADPRTGLLIASAAGERTAVMWPFGYSARLVDNVIELYDAEGRYVAREGDLVSMGGGSGANNFFYACAGTVQRAT